MNKIIMLIGLLGGTLQAADRAQTVKDLLAGKNAPKIRHDKAARKLEASAEGA